MKMQISGAVKLTLWREKIVCGKKTLGVQKKKRGSTGFSSAPKTHETYRVCSHVAIAQLSHSIVNTATGCYSCRQALGRHFYLLLQLVSAKKKANVPDVLKVKGSP